MKKLAIMLSALTLASASSVIAAPAFVPTGKIISSQESGYELADDSFANSFNSYSSQFPSLIPANTQSVYGISAATGNSPGNNAPAVGDVNIVTYRAITALSACTFQFTYLGNQKFQIVSLTANPYCAVKNGTDLVLP